MNSSKMWTVLLIVGGVLVTCVLCSGLWLAGGYNTLVTREETVRNRWADVQNMYQRRADLANQLVSAVSAEMTQETEVFGILRDQAGALAGAFTRDQMGNPVVPEGDQARELEQRIAEFDQALVNAIGYVADNPEIVTGELMRNLMIQIEGSENRVSIARKDYNSAVNQYRRAVRTFPSNIIAGLFGFDANAFPYFQASEDAQTAPDLDFNQ